MHHSKSGKRSTFSHKVGQKWVFVGGLWGRGGGGEVQEVHFLGPKGPLFGGPAPPKIDPGYGPASNIYTGLNHHHQSLAEQTTTNFLHVNQSVAEKAVAS